MLFCRLFQEISRQNKQSVLIYCIRFKHINSLNFRQYVYNNSSLKVSSKILFHCNFCYKHFHYKNQSKKHYANNKRQLLKGAAWEPSNYWNTVRKFAEFPFTEPIKQKHRHRQKCRLNVTQEETSNSINSLFVKIKVT